MTVSCFVANLWLHPSAAPAALSAAAALVAPFPGAAPLAAALMLARSDLVM